ncbi:MerR family transcriptional regulator [Nakamurella antarctica]|uniref:MerR family transcriptional regulator n=1 Tax=Nakamurella antarctica TaxID=1902245 RepID=A0A3G8ZYK5_9ACTN|nr:helix-turn-helix transcriptional regulator [Nakamurella antarctica]AZI59106.1 MerR family transcriptional regulator [Nakamurella antarctica]
MTHARQSREFNELTPLFVISVAAELAGMHAQTLRSYDREGLVSPGRTAAGGRRYSQRDISLLREVQRLSQEEGVNRAGIKRIIELDAQVLALQSRLDEISDDLAVTHARLRDAQAHAVTSVADASAAVHASYRRDLVPWKATGSAIITWAPPKRRS